MSRFKEVIKCNWPLFIAFPVLLFAAIIGIFSIEDTNRKIEEAEKLCYPYVILAQTDEIVVCAGIENPVVKNRR